MYFLILNISLCIFFALLAVIGIKYRIWSYIPVNVFGLILCGVTIGMDSLELLSQFRILILLGLFVFIFIFDFFITYRDIPEFTEEDEDKILYLTSPQQFEHFKIIADQRVMKKELDKNNEIAISDRLQALQTWKLGNRAYLRNNYQEALEKFDLSCNWISTSVAYLNQSGVLIKLKQYDDSIALAEKAIEINPQSFEAFMNLGIALQNLLRFDAALTKFEQAANIKPDNFEAWYCCGFLQLKLKSFEKSIESFNKAIHLNPKYYEAWYHKGIGLKNIGKDDLALKCFNQVVKIHPHHFQAYYRKANILNEMDYIDEAITSYNQALKIKPDYIEAWNNRGIVLCKISKTKQAISSYDRALKINPKYYEAWINRGLALDSLGKYKQAMQSYQKFLELAPQDNNKYIKITKRRLSEMKDQFEMKPDKRKKQSKSEPEKNSIEIQFAEEV